MFIGVHDEDVNGTSRTFDLSTVGAEEDFLISGGLSDLRDEDVGDDEEDEEEAAPRRKRHN